LFFGPQPLQSAAEELLISGEGNLVYLEGGHAKSWTRHGLAYARVAEISHPAEMPEAL
jgi:hypothetical protein